MFDKDFFWTFFVIFINTFLVWLLAAFYFEGYFERHLESCSSVSSSFGAAQDKGDMRIILAYVPSFSSTYSVLTSWGAGSNEIPAH